MLLPAGPALPAAGARQVQGNDLYNRFKPFLCLFSSTRARHSSCCCCSFHSDSRALPKPKRPVSTAATSGTAIPEAARVAGKYRRTPSHSSASPSPALSAAGDGMALYALCSIGPAGWKSVAGLQQGLLAWLVSSSIPEAATNNLSGCVVEAERERAGQNPSHRPGCSPGLSVACRARARLQRRHLLLRVPACIPPAPRCGW